MIEEGTSWVDIAYRITTPIEAWEVVERVQPFGPQKKKLRIQVNYTQLQKRLLAPAFENREQLDKYVLRWHPNFAGKEVVDGKVREDKTLIGIEASRSVGQPVTLEFPVLSPVEGSKDGHDDTCQLDILLK